MTADRVDRGAEHQARLAASGERRALGAFYTPADVVEGLLDLALEPLLERRAAGGPEALASLRVLDPSCGSGVVLLAVGERIAARLVAAGVRADRARDLAFGRCVAGVDVDPLAVELCRSALAEASAGEMRRDEKGRRDEDGRRAGKGQRHEEGRRVRWADALVLPGDGPAGWEGWEARLGAAGGWDLVVGNPPFLSQLGAGTARDRGSAAALRERFGPAVGGYADPAAIFLLLGVERARPDGGVVALIQPRSTLAARDAAPIRSSVLEGSALVALWDAGGRVFDADVEVCAPVLVRGRAPGEVALVAGRSFRSRGTAPAPSTSDRSWSPVLAAARGVPVRRLRGSGRLGDLADASADFRDQYYGLAPHVVDDADADDASRPPLVTAGLIDPAELAWGRRTSRFGKVDRLHPRVVRAGLDGRLAGWAERRLVPKVLVAPQARVLEAVVDVAGRFLPSVPVVTVVPRGAAGAGGDDLWRIAAVLTAPPVVAEAARRHLGSGLSGDALRVPPRGLLDLPLPPDEVAWSEGAAAFRRASGVDDAEARSAHLGECARAMVRAYLGEDDDELLTWWLARLPRRR